jgi:hypothetical protein
MTATLASAAGGAAALDEPESHAHPSMLGALAPQMRRATENQTRVVVATHSRELVRAEVAELASAPDSVPVVGPRMEAGAIDAIVVSGEDAHRRVVELADASRL